VDGRLKLFRRDAVVNAECLDFDISTHDIPGQPAAPDPGDRAIRLHFSPTCFRRSSAVRLLAEFEARGRKWVKRFLEQKTPSEYNLLGHAAMVLEGGAGLRAHRVQSRRPPPLRSAFPKTAPISTPRSSACAPAAQGIRAIQSSLGLDIDRIAAAFSRVEAAHRGA